MSPSIIAEAITWRGKKTTLSAQAFIIKIMGTVDTLSAVHEGKKEKKKARCRAFAVFAIITGTSVVQEPALTCASTVNWDEKKL